MTLGHRWWVHRRVCLGSFGGSISAAERPGGGLVLLPHASEDHGIRIGGFGHFHHLARWPERWWRGRPPWWCFGGSVFHSSPHHLHGFFDFLGKVDPTSERFRFRAAKAKAKIPSNRGRANDEEVDRILDKISQKPAFVDAKGKRDSQPSLEGSAVSGPLRFEVKPLAVSGARWAG